MQSVSERFGLAIYRLIAPALLGIVVVLSATPALAADPADYLDSMPTASEVMTTFTGSNALDTAAQQYAALERLDQLMGTLTTDHTMNPAERVLKDSYYNNPGWAGLVASVQASLPEDQRAYVSGTQFAEWRALIDHYRADSAFNARFRSLFPSTFTTTYASQLAQLEAGGRNPSLPPPTTIVPADLTTLRFPIVIASLFVGMAIFALLLKRGRLELDKQNPFRLYVGSRTYDLRHVTGVVSGASKMSTTRVYGSGGG